MPTTESMVMVWDTTATEDTPDTPMLIMDTTTARGPLMLSPPPMLMPTTTEPMVWDTEDTLVCTTDTPDTPMLIMDSTMARGPLMLSPPPLPSLRLMPTTATTAMVPGPTMVWATEDTDTEATEATTMDKFSASEVQSR